jgi:hAT family C-terminal dimerisation region
VSNVKEYVFDSRRVSKLVAQFGEKSTTYEIVMTGKENYRVNTFLVIIDCLITELGKRKAAYKKLNDQFGFISKLPTNELNSAEIQNNASLLIKSYHHDLEESLSEECIHFKGFLKALNITVKTNVIKIGRLMAEHKLESVYPNLNIAIRMFASTACANCSGERAFSTLKRIKNYTRSTMGQQRLDALSILAIESDVLNKMSVDNIIDEFAARKARKVPL